MKSLRSKSVLVFVILTALQAVPPAARAEATSSLTVQGHGFILDPIHNIEPDCAVGPGAPSVNCSGTVYVDNFAAGYARIVYRAQARAAFGDLKTSTSLNITTGLSQADVSAAGGSPVRGAILAMVGAEAGFTDTWTISGGVTGTPGTLRVAYHVTGTIVHPPKYQPELAPPQDIGGSSMSFTIGPATYYFLTGGGVHETVHADVPFTFDEPFEFGVTMGSGSGMDASNFVLDAAELATRSDFYNTASLAGLEVFDGGGTKVSFHLKTASDSDAFQQFATPPVPEVSTLTLSGAGMALLFALRALQRRGARAG
ncbi:MAG: hypothetical protein U1F52_17480 [Burkholderiales bacterium]